MTAIAATPVQSLRVADLHTTLFNPRSPDVAKAAGLPVSEAFSEAKLRALGASIASPTGQLEAILVRPHPTIAGAFQIADGERRYRAAVLCGIEQLAAKVRELTDAEMVEIALAHGTGDHVESLTAIEEAAGYRTLKGLRAFSDRQLADHLRRPVQYVTRRLALLELPVNSAKALQEGRLPAMTAYLIASIPGEAERLEAEKSILKSEIHGGVMSYRAASEYIADKICRPLKAPAFDMKDATLLPEAGACTGCRFRAGNNPEEYGHVVDPEKGGGTDKCMHPACYRKKEEAHRARVVTKVAVDGKQALSPEDNARAFPPDERGLHYSSEFVPYEQRPTPDLLKKEVAPSSAPTWREIVEGGEAKVQIYVGVHQDGHAVDLVKRHEAIAAADVNERRIFADTEVKRAAEKLERGDSIAAADRAAQHETRERDLAAQSRAAQEKAEADARKKAEKAQKKKDKASRALLAELFDKLRAEDERQHPIWRGYPAQSLLFETLRDALTAEETAFVVATCDPEAGEDEQTRAGLNDLSSRLPLDHLAALNLVLALAPRWRAQGAEGELAKEWSRKILAGLGEAAPVVAVPEESAATEEEQPAAPAFRENQIVEWGRGHVAGFWGWWYPAADAQKLTGETFAADQPGRGQSCVVRLQDGVLLINLIATAALRPVDEWQADSDYPGCPQAALDAAKNPLPPEPADHGVGVADRARRTRARKRAEREGDQRPATIPVSPEEAAKLAEIVKADAAGMPIPEIARAYGMQIEDVVGALGTEPDEVTARAALEAAWEAVMDPTIGASVRRTIMAKYAKRVSGEAKFEAELTPTEIMKVVAILRKAEEGKKAGRKATPAAATEPEQEAA